MVGPTRWRASPAVWTVVAGLAAGCGFDSTGHGELAGLGGSTMDADASGGPSGTTTSDPSASTTGTSSSASEAGSAAGSSGGPGGCGSDWWNEDWTARIPVTIDEAALATDFEGLVIPLSFAGVDLPDAATDGRDVRVVAGDGQSVPFELEGWSSAIGGVVWVRLPPEVAVAGQTRLHLYVGNPQAAPAADPAAVWSDYAGVWHLSEDAGGELPNSAPADIPGVLTGTTRVAGQLAGARRFSPDGSHRVDFAGEADALFAGWETMSLSLWVFPDFASDGAWIESQGRVLTRTAGAITLGRTWWPGQVAGTGVFQLDVHFAGGPSGYLQGSIRRQSWNWIVYDYDGSSLRLYVNGESVGDHDAFGTALASVVAPMWLGGDYNAMPGVVDEFRIAQASRSAKWYQMQYQAMTGELATLGEVQTCP